MSRALLALAGLLLVVAPPAGAAFPGKNGRIAFMCGERHTSLCTMAPDGSRLRELAASMEDPSWAPGGRRLAFHDSFFRPFVAASDGSSMRKLLENGASPAWSPDGRALVFSAGGLGVLNLASGRTRVLTTPPEGHSDGEPAWSPDGRSVAFVRLRFQTSCHEDVCGVGAVRSDLYMIRSDGGGERLILPGQEVPYVFFSHSPSWSPDGRRLAVHHQGGLYVVRRDGSGLRALGLAGAEPAWSPNGRWIAYTGLGDGYVHLIRTDGSRSKRLCRGRDPDWQQLGPRARAPRRGGQRCRFD